MTVMHRAIGLALCAFLWTGSGWAADPADVEKFVKARIEIGEMMTNYFAGGGATARGNGPRPNRCRTCGRTSMPSSARSWRSMT